jgi:hypothetical protein
MSTNSDDKVTKPTIETVLERIVSLEERFSGRIDSLEARMNARFDGVDARFGQLDTRLDELDIKLDRVGSAAHSTRGEMLELRADFREWNKRLRERLPALA